MRKIENIYTKDTMQNHKSWEHVYFYKAFKIVFNKFKCVRDSFNSISPPTLYSKNLKKDLSNINVIFSQSLTEHICNCYYHINGKKITIANKNNIEDFLKFAFDNISINKKLKDKKINKNDCITIRDFCSENNLNEGKFKKNLRDEGYYNSQFTFMPTRKSMDRGKVFLTNYFTSYCPKTNKKDKGDFYILWEKQFLRNMMLKHYKKCEKDTETYKIRYVQPKTYKILMTRIIDIITHFSMLDFGINAKSSGTEWDNGAKWDNLSSSLQEHYYNQAQHGKFFSYSNFKYFEEEINKIVLDKFQNTVNETLRFTVFEFLKVFNQYAKHYEDKYNN